MGATQMRKVVRLLLCLASFAVFAATAWAQQPAASAKQNIDWPSPDGRFAFLATYDEYLRTLDLIDKASGKKLQRIGNEDSSQAYWHVLWASGSDRFALMTRMGHPIQGIDVFFRNGDTFRKIELPDLPEANIPEKLKHGKKFPHYANMNWQEAEKWMKDGSLVSCSASIGPAKRGS
jgi:hypothetical protein